MKINTDGTLLAVLSEKDKAQAILDIGTGTGVVALMLSQRFPNALVDAIEIDEQAAITAEKNFEHSVFAAQLSLYLSSFQEFSIQHPHKKYDLIVSNPPFFINSLKNADAQKQIARHADDVFFVELLDFACLHLQPGGIFSIILPLETADTVKKIASGKSLYLTNVVHICSFEQSQPHRELLSFSMHTGQFSESRFVIYSIQKEYSNEFINKLKDFFIIF